MVLWFCPVCGDMYDADSRPIPCPNNECHAFRLLPCIKYYKDPLANMAELEIEYMECLQ